MIFITGLIVKGLVFFLVIGMLVLVHEFGHFLLAKLCGVGVLKFAVGFGPAILRFKRGETVYQIGCIPLGGFVRMVGDMPDMITGAQATDDAVREELVHEGDADLSHELFADKSRWFILKGFWAKSAIVFAGPFFNFVFAFVVAVACGYMYGEESLVEEPLIGDVIKNSPGEKAGLKEGDLVKSIDGVALVSWKDLADKIHDAGGKSMSLEIQRGSASVPLVATPQGRPATVNGEKKVVYFLGLSPSTRHTSLSFGGSLDYGCKWLKEKTYITYLGLYGMMVGAVSPKDLAGPIFIFQETGKQVEKGFESLLYFMAIISVSLAVLNLLPIPVLDGGHLLFFLLEAIIGPISIRKKEFAQQIGMLLLLCLMVFALKNDVLRPAQQEADWDTLTKQDDKDGTAENAAAGTKDAPVTGAPVGTSTAQPTP